MAKLEVTTPPRSDYVCDCARPAEYRLVKSRFKNGQRNPNYGRHYYACATDNCEYFRWAEEPKRNAPVKKRPTIDLAESSEEEKPSPRPFNPITKSSTGVTVLICPNCSESLHATVILGSHVF
jgi:hypothetical protein